jgi:hypothetical protein
VRRRAGGPVASGSKGSLSMTHSASAVLVAAALSASVVVPAFGQTPAQTTETTPTQTTTAPTQTTTAPTETTMTTTPESPEPTSAPNEYVESIPTGGGQAPATQQQKPVVPAPVAPAPATPATPSGTTTSDETPSAAPPKKKARRRPHRSAHQRRHRRPAETPAPAGPAVPSTPAAAEAGEPADPLLLGLALLAITVGVLSTAVARRQGVGT